MAEKSNNSLAAEGTDVRYRRITKGLWEILKNCSHFPQATTLPPMTKTSWLRLDMIEADLHLVDSGFSVALFLGRMILLQFNDEWGLV
ncbi:MAG: hypothetical protein MJZ67_02230 [Bacteroidales bacterium]|nr:hypothetical protein [Bacteroidales bacterium]